MEDCKKEMSVTVHGKSESPMRMKTKYIQRFAIVLTLLVSFTLINCTNPQDNKTNNTNSQNKKTIKYKVTFIELGSVRCIPCQKMQPVMKSIEEKYPKQVQVIFYDVWTPEGKPFAKKHKIQVIPTQVFLDEDGKEYYRHTGFFPEKELIKVLKTKGVK